MNNSFFDDVGDNQEGFFTATAADVDVFHPLNEVEEYSVSFSPLNYPYNYCLETMFDEDDDYNNMVEYFQDHHRDMDINISEYPILNGIDDHMLISRNDTTPLPLPPTSIVLPSKDIFMDNKELILFHLVMAYKEAMEIGQEDLAEVIEKRIGDKVSPVGDTALERLMYYVFQTLDTSHDYLKQESFKNFFPAFGTFYQIFPYGKFAHFVANSAILEALPLNCASSSNSSVVVIRIFDFDVGEGIQWSSLIGSIISNPQQQILIREVIITSVKLDDHDDSSNHEWKFEDTKRRLCDHAMSYGIKLTVEEIELRNLERCLININEEILRHEYQWFVFNCMVGLPHMGRVRSRKNVVEFLNSSQNFLQKCNNNGLDRWGGIVILGDGDSWEKVKNAPNYGAFLDGNLAHYRALLESIKCEFPIGLGEARVAMECLFVAPFVSSRRWAKQWKEKEKLCGNYYLEPERWVMRLEGWKIREERVMEARELVVRSAEGDQYGVRSIIDDGDQSSRNEIVLDWRGIPLVKVSCWRSNGIN